jgi:ATP-binding cassette subfamily F protein 3
MRSPACVAPRAQWDKARFKRGGKGDSGDKFAKGFFGNRTLETMRRAKSLERRLERLLTEERLEKPHGAWQMKLSFGEVPASGKDVLRLEGLAVGYRKEGDKGLGDVEVGEFEGDLIPQSPVVLLEDLNMTVRQGARVAVIGPNGAGKTTLVSTIAGLLPPLAGEVRLGANVRLGYMAQEQEDLDLSLDAFTTIQRLAH